MSAVKTPVMTVGARIPLTMLDVAREMFGAGLTNSEIMREALARALGLNPADYPVKLGRGPGKNSSRVRKPPAAKTCHCGAQAGAVVST